MGSLCQGQKCPSHPDKNVTNVCISKDCMQILCDTCTQNHKQIHRTIGFPPQIQLYGDFLKTLKSQKQYHNKKQLHQDALHQALPTAIRIKELTNQYFLKRYEQRKKSKELQQFVSNLQVWGTMASSSQVRNKVHHFLRNNLVVNKEVVESKFAHLYK